MPFGDFRSGYQECTRARYFRSRWSLALRWSHRIPILIHQPNKLRQRLYFYAIKASRIELRKDGAL